MLPFWTTHFFHTTVITVLLECIFDRVLYPFRRRGISYLLLFGAGYFGWISYIFLQEGKWPYPFMQVMSPIAFAGFMLSTALVCVCFYVLVEKLNNFVTRQQNLKTTLFHMVGWIHAAYCLHLYYEHIIWNPLFPKSIGGQWKYLTFINVNIQFIYFTIAGLPKILAALGFASFSRKVRSFRHDLFASIAAPVSLFVVTSFWIIFSINREFVHPRHLDDLAPFWTTHFFHTTVVSILLECYFDRIIYPTRKRGITYLIVFGIGYFCWISYVQRQAGSWPYPFMDLLSPTAFIAFAASTFFITTIYYILIEEVNNSLHGKSYKTA